MWYRVFCRSDQLGPTEQWLAPVKSIVPEMQTKFTEDRLGWTEGELQFGPGAPVLVARFLTEVDSLRNDLNTWAAYLETMDYSPNHGSLMERVIQSQQLITIRRPLDSPNEVICDRVCTELARALATAGDGIYQAEDDGWYSADGELLLKEY